MALISPENSLRDLLTYREDDREVSLIRLPTELQQAIDEVNQIFPETMSSETFRTIVTWAIVVGVVILILTVFLVILDYLGQVALIRMVNRYEETGEKVSWRQGFRLGWSRAAWRLFLVNLAVYLPVLVVFLILFGCASLPVLIAYLAGEEPTLAGIVATIGLVFLVIFLALIVAVILSIIMETIYREIVLQDAGAIAGLKAGLKRVRANFKDIGLMWMILVGVRIGFLFLLLPILILILFAGLFVGGAAGFGVYYLVQPIANNVASLVSAMIVGALVFFLVMGSPLLLLGGWFETYVSTTWTLTYRDLVKPSSLHALSNGSDLAVGPA
jgi:hypothetical protein